MTSCLGTTLTLGILVLDGLLVLLRSLVLGHSARVVVKNALLDKRLGVWTVRDLVVELVLEHVLLELQGRVSECHCTYYRFLLKRV